MAIETRHNPALTFYFVCLQWHSTPNTWIRFPLSFHLTASLPFHVLRSFILSKRNKLAVTQMIVSRPFDELELPDELRLQPQCRMTDYAVGGVRNAILKAICSQPRECCLDLRAA
jgi:hypothetical protein